MDSRIQVKNNAVDLSGREAFSDGLTDLFRSGAQRLIGQAVKAELQVFLSQFESRKMGAGLVGVARNGFQPKCQLQTGIGPVIVKVPKVRLPDLITVNQKVIEIHGILF